MDMFWGVRVKFSALEDNKLLLLLILLVAPRESYLEFQSRPYSRSIRSSLMEIAMMSTAHLVSMCLCPFRYCISCKYEIRVVL